MVWRGAAGDMQADVDRPSQQSSEHLQKKTKPCENSWDEKHAKSSCLSLHIEKFTRWWDGERWGRAVLSDCII